MSKLDNRSAEGGEVAETRTGNPPMGEGKLTGAQTRRPDMLAKGLGVAAAAVGTGAVLDLPSAGTAQAGQRLITLREREVLPHTPWSQAPGLPLRGRSVYATG
jgi:hypothetical protein